MFINEKIDLLTQYLIIEPLSALLTKWAPTLREYAKKVESTAISCLLRLFFVCEDLLQS